MSKLARLICFWLAIALLPVWSLRASALTSTNALSVSAQSAVLLDASRGDLLYAKNADARMPMASTTKVMTAIVALEHMDAGTEIAAPAEAIGVEGSSIYLTEGEVLTLEQLLYAVLLESANDAATAVAIAVGGSVEGFAALMNRKAAELGLSNTQFQNPHGLDAEGHYTTARELAKIMMCALENPLIAQMVATRKITVPHASTDGVRLLVNHNKMLRLYEGAIGGKTGYTKKSGRCLVSAAEREGVRLIAVTLNAPNDWNDHSSLFDMGFTLRKSVNLTDANGVCFPMDVVGGASACVMVSNPQALRTSLPSDAPSITKTVEAERFLYAPVAEGETVGKVVFRCDLDGDGKAEIIGETELKTQSGVDRAKKKRSFWQWLRSLFTKS